MDTAGSRGLQSGLGLRGLATSLPAVEIGALCLVAVLALTIALPPSPVTVLLAAAATVGLAADRSLGPVGAGILLALAVPWGRGADTLTYEIAGVPIRPHDAILAIALVGAALGIVRRRPRFSATLVLVAGFLAIGVGALVLGFVVDNAARDILRDARWWALYSLGLFVLLGAARRDQLVRGLLVGTALFAITIIVATILPDVPGGLKDQELTYDRGLLRMQFGNSAFLLPALAFVGARFLSRPRRLDAGWLVLLVVAVALSLTRTSMLASIGVLGLLLVIVWWDRRQAGRLRVRRFVFDAGRLVGLTAVALVGGIALNVVGTPGLIDDARGNSGGGGGQAVIGRVVFSDETSGIQSIRGGRFTSYRRAIERIAESPVVGLGLGALTPVEFAYNETRAYTVGQAAGVDNAYLTVALKGGIVAAAVFAALVGAAILTALRLNRRRRAWLLAGLAGLGVLTVTQSFATSLYGPAIVGVLFVLPALAQPGSGDAAPRAAGPTVARPS